MAGASCGVRTAFRSSDEGWGTELAAWASSAPREDADKRSTIDRASDGPEEGEARDKALG